MKLRASDPLSDVLGTLRLRGRIVARTEARVPWTILFPAGDAHFHVVEQGELVVTIEGVGRPIHAVAGDLLVLPHGAGHTVADRAGRRGVPLDDLLDEHWEHETRTLRIGRGSPGTRLICGTFDLDRRGRDTLLAVLPPVLHLRGQGGQPPERLDLVMRLFLAEAHESAPGRDLAVARLIDLILVQAIRAWLAEQPMHVGGWLGAMRDPHVGAALTRLHADPAHRWTVDELASLVGLSRSPLAARFTSLVGEPPLRYLTRWRMRLAEPLLRRGLSVSEVAGQVGYESEAAFSRAFKKHTGRSPSQARHHVLDPR